MRQNWSFFSAGQLVFGWDSARQVGQHAKHRGLNHVFLVTDPNLVQAGVVEPVQKSFADAGVEVELFAEGEAEPSLEVAIRAGQLARDANADAIVGLGGGSNMDLAKITAVLATHSGVPQDYFSFDNVPGPVTPLICLPTTAGTGSEVSHAAVLTDAANAIKVSTLSRHLRPALAIVDSALTLSCPAHVTAESGIDALTHAIEGYTATLFREMPYADGEPCAYDGSFPLADMLAEQAIRSIGHNLRIAVSEPENREAREAMAMAATLAGLAFSNAGVALVHAMEYPLGGALHCSHGAGNGLLLPYVMRFLRPQRRHHLAKIAEWLGRDTRGLTPDEAADAAIEEVISLKADIGIPARIRDLGGDESQLPEFARKAFSISRLMETTPRETSEEALLDVYRDAF